MGDTVHVNFVDSEYTAIPSLVTGTVYWLQNVTNHQLMLLQQSTQPDVTAIGKRVNPTEEAEIIKEDSDVWIKSVIGDGLAIYNSVPEE